MSILEERSDQLKLTEHEGILLSGILRQQPVTAYQLFRATEASPVTSINASKGQIYPAIRRLKARGFVAAQRVAADARKSEKLYVTDRGYAAVRQWTLTLNDSHIMLDDPLRTKVLSFDVLSRTERLEWIASAKALVKKRREILDEYNRTVKLPYQGFAYRSAVEMLRLKMEWLDDLLYEVAGSD